MIRLTKIAAASLAAMALGLTLAACQPQVMAPPAQEVVASEATASPEAMTVAEVQELVVGNTVFIRDEANSVSRAEYFSPDGTVHMKAKPDGFGMTFSFDGTYKFDDQGQLCANFPTLPVADKGYCEHVVPLGDGRYEVTGGGIYEQILEGEQLDELK